MESRISKRKYVLRMIVSANALRIPTEEDPPNWAFMVNLGESSRQFILSATSLPSRVLLAQITIVMAESAGHNLRIALSYQTLDGWMDGWIDGWMDGWMGG